MIEREAPFFFLEKEGQHMFEFWWGFLGIFRRRFNRFFFVGDERHLEEGQAGDFEEMFLRFLGKNI